MLCRGCEKFKLHSFGKSETLSSKIMLSSKLIYVVCIIHKSIEMDWLDNCLTGIKIYQWIKMNSSSV